MRFCMFLTVTPATWGSYPVRQAGSNHQQRVAGYSKATRRGKTPRMLYRQPGKWDRMMVRQLDRSGSLGVHCVTPWLLSKRRGRLYGRKAPCWTNAAVSSAILKKINMHPSRIYVVKVIDQNWFIPSWNDFIRTTRMWRVSW